MTAGHSFGPARSALRGLARAAWLAAALVPCGALAMPVTYQCTGYRILTGEFTPRGAQIHFEGQDYALRRVGDAREATFVDGRHGVTVVARQRELALHLPNEALACKLQSSALESGAAPRPATPPPIAAPITAP